MISACTFQMLLIIPTILLNGISVITIMKCPQLKEKIAYFLIMTQSIADLAVGFISLPLMSYVCMTQILGNADCLTQRIILVIASFSFFMSPTALIAMSVDRYLSVVYPLKHRVMVTKKKITHFLAYGNLFMLAFTDVSVLKVKVLDAFHSTYLLLFIILAIFVYTKIFITIRNKKRPGNVAENTTQNRENQRKFLKEVKLVKSCFLAVASFLLCYLAGASLVAFQPYPNDTPNAVLLKVWAGTASLLNSSLNSIMFFWTRPLLRSEAFKVLKKTCRLPCISVNN